MDDENNQKEVDAVAQAAISEEIDESNNEEVSSKSRQKGKKSDAKSQKSAKGQKSSRGKRSSKSIQKSQNGRKSQKGQNKNQKSHQIFGSKGQGSETPIPGAAWSITNIVTSKTSRTFNCGKPNRAIAVRNGDFRIVGLSGQAKVGDAGYSQLMNMAGVSYSEKGDDV